MSAVVYVVIGVLIVLSEQSAATIAAGLLMVAMGLYGGLCLRLLWARDRSAPTQTQRWLGTAAVLWLAVGVLRDNMSGTGQGVLWWAIWGLYLARSKRVARTFGPRRPAPCAPAPPDPAASTDAVTSRTRR